MTTISYLGLATFGGLNSFSLCSAGFGHGLGLRHDTSTRS